MSESESGRTMSDAMQISLAKGFGTPSRPAQTPLKATARLIRRAGDAKPKGPLSQFNVRIELDLKEAVTKAAEREGVSLVEWVERSFRASLDASDEAVG
ncbi:toxin-antitoxin system HicB family antitoxin [Rhodomicrobium vannielii ATCC 17100]|uniref:toxin-antitoxin system HicB family antitoxin n=1 Tax=Rhodomicrobium vannielii TaxID=1069 RepID=UPI001918483D|nr:toxin-antitoxin system HicB family antitoxin [Rhodomicrobium vannielii]MBJ7532682.1 toxin-antitoxin system HicB family antitoxin [Rhodomicrobium vannielii ATCC 17100]